MGGGEREMNTNREVNTDMEFHTEIHMEYDGAA